MSPLLPGIIASGISGHLTPPWDGPEGAFDALATITLSSTTASVTFSGIPQGYKHLQLRASFQTTRPQYNIDDLNLSFNGITSGGKYTTHSMEANIQNNGTVTPYNTYNANQIFYIATGVSTVSANRFGAAVIDILDYTDTSKNTTVRALSGGDANGGADGYYPTVRFASGMWNDTSAVTSLRIESAFGSSSLAANTTFSLYGVK